ncbi:MAG: Uma2 family endonuclease [Candidatus Eremiobacteraeota bacterium]|nr:Uma2 family endonuclease [Candidatus Eremiobacteraeota bacterium]
MIAQIFLPAGDDDLLRISAENPGWTVERSADRRLIMTPPTGGESSRRNALLTASLVRWAEANDYIAFDSSAGFRLPDTSVVSPDGALVPRSTWEALTNRDREKIVRVIPTVAIELVSYSDEPAMLREKLERLRALGTSYVVLIDPYRETIWTDGTPLESFTLDFTQLLHPF